MLCGAPVLGSQFENFWEEDGRGRGECVIGRFFMATEGLFWQAVVAFWVRCPVGRANAAIQGSVCYVIDIFMILCDREGRSLALEGVIEGLCV